MASSRTAIWTNFESVSPSAQESVTGAAAKSLPAVPVPEMGVSVTDTAPLLYLLRFTKNSATPPSATDTESSIVIPNWPYGLPPIALAVLGWVQDARGEVYLLANGTGTLTGTAGMVLRIDP